MDEGVAARNAAGNAAALPRFAIVAGTGWLLDALILLGAVRLAGLPPGAANILSSLTAAAFVYLVAHHRVHRGRAGFIPARTALYVVYTVALILLVSLPFAMLVRGLQAVLPGAGAVLAAKILITPPQFLCNFLMSRHLAARSFGSAP